MGNPVTNHLPADIDSFLQDVAQMYGTINYTDMYNFKPTKEQIARLRDIHVGMCNTDEESELTSGASLVSIIVKGESDATH